MSSRDSGGDRAHRYHATALRMLAKLSAGDSRQKTLHELRTHLRRLQAYLELVGEDQNAKVMARCVSKLSRLRTLQVFERYLSRLGSPKSDLRKIKVLIRSVRAKLERKQRYQTIERLVQRHALPPTPARHDWLAHRLAALRRANADALRQMIVETADHPRRKALHALRLKVKAIRYQEEWALGRPFARPDLVSQLKQAQAVLGDYEERAQFRKLAAKLRLKSFERIEQDWRRARQCARAVSADLIPVAESMAGGRLRLVRSETPVSRPGIPESA